MKRLFTAVALIAILGMPIQSSRADETAADAAYKHVTEQGILRCGYAPWPDLLDVAPNTKQLSGVFYDYMNELARTMDIKVEWVAEVPFGEIPQALNQGRVDAICSGAWTNPVRGKFVDSIVPVAYQYITIFARADDNRFDNHSDKINAPEVKISVIDGESSSAIALASFPNAKTIANPQGTDGTQMLMDVVTGKADVAFTDLATLDRIIKNNPGKIRQVKTDFPLQVFGTPIWVKKGETKLKNSLDIATMQLINDGTIDRILTKHEKVKGEFLRPTTAYQSFH